MGLALLIAPGGPAQAKGEGMILIEGARVFDGTGAKAKIADVLVDGDTIVSVGRHIDPPAGATRIDGRGKTLIPGLHDLHTHVRSPAYDAPEDLPKAWAGYLLAGVTTLNDYSVSGEMIAPIRELTAHPGAAGSFGPPTSTRRSASASPAGMAPNTGGAASSRCRPPPRARRIS